MVAGICSLSLAHAQSFKERFAALDLADTDPVALSSQPGFISPPRAQTEEVFRGVRINPPANVERAPSGLVSAYAPDSAGASGFDLWSPRLSGTRANAVTPPPAKPAAAVRAPSARNIFARSSGPVEAVDLPAQSASGPIYREVTTKQAHYIASKFRPRPVPEQLERLIAEKAKRHGVPLQLAHAVVAVESNYNPTVTGRASTIGLMQIKHATARGVGFSGAMQELYDPATNLEYGMKYLGGAYKLARGDLCGTIMRYQGGHYAKSMSADAVVYCAKVQRLLGTQASRVASAAKPAPPRGY